jgi:hypothetical protein
MFRMTRMTRTIGGPALRLEGESKPSWLPVLELEVDRLLRRGRRVVLDFHGVTSVLLTSIGTLRRLAARGASIENSAEWARFLLQRGITP